MVPYCSPQNAYSFVDSLFSVTFNEDIAELFKDVEKVKDKSGGTAGGPDPQGRLSEGGVAPGTPLWVQ